MQSPTRDSSVISVTFHCGGCLAVAEGTGRLSRTFVSVTGKSHGIGSYQYNIPQDVAPEGWIAFDPYTSCTYCPTCWEEILAVPERKVAT